MHVAVYTFGLSNLWTYTFSILFKLFNGFRCYLLLLGTLVGVESQPIGYFKCLLMIHQVAAPISNSTFYQITFVICHCLHDVSIVLYNNVVVLQ